MKPRQWPASLFGAALLLSLGCQEETTSPSEPIRSIEESLSAEDEALADQIEEDILCLYDGGNEKAFIKRLRDLIKRKEKAIAGPLMDQAAGMIDDVFEDYEEGDLNNPAGEPAECDTSETTAEVTERLLINLAEFGDFGEFEPGFLTGNNEASTIFTFDLREGHTEVLPSDFGDCIGVSFPIQETQSGQNTCTMSMPRVDPGFAGEGKGTAPFWITLQCLPFTGPYSPAIYTAWYVLDEDDGDEPLEGFDPGDPVPAGVPVTACTIRDGVGLLCADPEAEEGDDLFQTTGELLNGNLACDGNPGGTAMETGGFHGFVNNLFQPISRFAEVRPLWADPGNLGLRSSFSSDFGVQFDQGGIDYTVDGDTIPVTLFHGDTAFMAATVTPTPSPEDDAQIVFSAIGDSTGDVSSDSIAVVEGLAQGTIICDTTGGEAGFEADLVLDLDNYQTGAELVGTEQVSNIVNVSCNFFSGPD